MYTTKYAIKLFLLSFVFLTSSNTQAAEESGLIINTMTMGFGGISISFTTQPSACAGSFNTMHAFIDQNTTDFTEMMVLIGQKRLTKEPVKITFSNSGDCTSQSTLLKIDAIN